VSSPVSTEYATLTPNKDGGAQLSRTVILSDSLVFKTSCEPSRTALLKWRTMSDSNTRYSCEYDALAKRCDQPLCQSSIEFGRPWMNRTPASRFGGEKTTTILTTCRKLKLNTLFLQNWTAVLDLNQLNSFCRGVPRSLRHATDKWKAVRESHSGLSVRSRPSYVLD
jgi:hypothetical protein